MKNPSILLRCGGQFACLNSGDGFVSYFDEILRECSYVYAVKGGPGTGKSGLLSYIADESERRGEPAVRIFCSSDPYSLDGVILPYRSLALVDATAPHLFEPKTPGVDGEFVNLGAFWDRPALAAQKPRINALSAEKSNAYRRAFDILAASKRLKNAQKSLLSASVRASAFDKAVRRAASACADKNRVGGRAVIRPRAAIGMFGRVELSDPSEAEQIFTLRPSLGAEELFLSALVNALSGASLFVSPDPVSRAPESIFLPDRRVLFRVGAPLDLPGEKLLSPGRLFSPSPDVRRALRAYERGLSSLSDLCTRAFSEVRSAHFSLEEIYKSAMDFSFVDELKTDLARRIFGDPISV